MSYIPDCRKDANYNYNNLKDEDKRIIDGYDRKSFAESKKNNGRCARYCRNCR